MYCNIDFLIASRCTCVAKFSPVFVIYVQVIEDTYIYIYFLCTLTCIGD